MIGSHRFQIQTWKKLACIIEAFQAPKRGSALSRIGITSLHALNTEALIGPSTMLMIAARTKMESSGATANELKHEEGW